MEYHKFIEKLQGIACHTLLNRDQKKKFVEAEVSRFFSTLEEADLPGIRTSIRISKRDDDEGWKKTRELCS